MEDLIIALNDPEKEIYVCMASLPCGTTRVLLPPI